MYFTTRACLASMESNMLDKNETLVWGRYHTLLARKCPFFCPQGTSWFFLGVARTSQLPKQVKATCHEGVAFILVIACILLKCVFTYFLYQVPNGMLYFCTNMHLATLWYLLADTVFQS